MLVLGVVLCLAINVASQPVDEYAFSVDICDPVIARGIVVHKEWVLKDHALLALSVLSLIIRCDTEDIFQRSIIQRF